MSWTRVRYYFMVIKLMICQISFQLNCQLFILRSLKFLAFLRSFLNILIDLIPSNQGRNQSCNIWTELECIILILGGAIFQRPIPCRNLRGILKHLKTLRGCQGHPQPTPQSRRTSLPLMDLSCRKKAVIFLLRKAPKNNHSQTIHPFLFFNANKQTSTAFHACSFRESHFF